MPLLLSSQCTIHLLSHLLSFFLFCLLALESFLSPAFSLLSFLRFRLSNCWFRLWFFAGMHALRASLLSAAHSPPCCKREIILHFLLHDPHSELTLFFQGFCVSRFSPVSSPFLSVFRRSVLPMFQPFSNTKRKEESLSSKLASKQCKLEYDCREDRKRQKQTSNDRWRKLFVNFNKHAEMMMSHTKCMRTTKETFQSGLNNQEQENGSPILWEGRREEWRLRWKTCRRHQRMEKGICRIIISSRKVRSSRIRTKSTHHRLWSKRWIN